MKRFFTALVLAGGLIATAQETGDTLEVKYSLNGQTRRFKTVFTPGEEGSMTAEWSIVRNLVPWHGSYTTTAAALQHGTNLSYVMPEDGNRVTLPEDQTHLILSQDNLNSLLNNGEMTLDGLKWKLSGQTPELLTARNELSGATMEIKNSRVFPIVLSMQGNPMKINWKVNFKPAEAEKMTAREQIAREPGKSGGIYYAYPYNDDVMPSIPAGYKPVHVSHYGRHGSRWLIKTWEYDEVLNCLDSAHHAGVLTPSGEDVYERMKVISEHARGHKGELSSLGARQHRGIAERMAWRFPFMMADSARITAYSSIEPRCIISMAAFSERLKELNPTLQVERHASPGDMDFISYSNAETREINDEKSPWWRDLEKWRNDRLDAGRLNRELFTDTTFVSDPKRFVWLLHDVAVDCQDSEPGVELLDLFTPDEMYALWSALNYKMYYIQGNNPRTQGAGPRSAANLLEHFINDVDSALTAERPGRTATLRFGHDTALMRLLALMQVNGADASIENPEDYAAGWNDFYLTPMAANLQVILLTSTAGEEPLVMIRHNERPARLPLTSQDGGYYRWSDVRTLWHNNIKTARETDAVRMK